MWISFCQGPSQRSPRSDLTHTGSVHARSGCRQRKHTPRCRRGDTGLSHMSQLPDMTKIDLNTLRLSCIDCNYIRWICEPVTRGVGFYVSGGFSGRFSSTLRKVVSGQEKSFFFWSRFLSKGCRNTAVICGGCTCVNWAHALSSCLLPLL